MSFQAFVLRKDGDTFSARVETLADSDLPRGDVTIRVAWSCVNFKDGLATARESNVVRNYPMIPGVDLAGTVESSSDSRFAKGQAVVVTGYDLGISHFGGYSELARVPSDWVAPLPGGMSLKEAMALGTAGFTTALSVEAMERMGLRTDNGTVLVTGATGGVGSTAVSMLAGRGYTVAGSTGKAAEHDYLRHLGATEVLSREEVSAESKRVMEAERWAGAVDPVGGATTAYLARTVKYGGSIALSGLTGGNQVQTTVYPFILRGVNILGIESVWTPMAERVRLWQRMAEDLKPAGLLDSIAVEADLDGVADATATILKGGVRGRVLIRVGGG